MGIVYLAQRGAERVALKAVAPQIVSDPSARTRFLREAQSLRRVTNPFVAQILDSGEDSESPWIAVEFVSGPSMKELVEHNGPLDADAWWATALALASALEEIHSQGVTHRDIKPGNVLASDMGPKLIDFGIALTSDDTSLTATGALAGSPAWLSPEQFDGDEVDSASDMFSFGSLLVFLASGVSPWGNPAKATNSTLMRAIISKEPELSALDATQQAIVKSLLTKNPRERLSARLLTEKLLEVSPALAVARFRSWEAFRHSSTGDFRFTENMVVAEAQPHKLITSRARKAPRLTRGRATRVELYGLYIAGLILAGGAGIGVASAVTWDDSRSSVEAVTEEGPQSNICVTGRGQPGEAAPSDCTCVIEGPRTDFPNGTWDVGGLFKDDGTPECQETAMLRERQNLELIEREYKLWTEANAVSDSQTVENTDVVRESSERPESLETPSAPKPPPVVSGLPGECIIEQAIDAYVEAPPSCWCVVTWTRSASGISVAMNHAGPGGSGADCHREYLAIRRNMTGQ
jgi:hypothetical protein